MPGLVIDGDEHRIDGLDILNYTDDQRLSRGSEDGRRRKTRWVRQQINHTTKGIPGGDITLPQWIRPDGEDRGKEFDVAKFWSTSPKQSGAHTVIDTDGSIGQTADLLKVAMYHAGGRVNEFSIGHEIYQLNDASIFQATIEACVKLNMAICGLFGIQFQIHRPYTGPIDRRWVSCVGIFGHHDVTSNRGPGDPGEFIKDALVTAGAEAFDFDEEEDIIIWKERQYELGVYADGVPGPLTVQALRQAGYRHGVWAFGKEGHAEPLAVPLLPNIKRLLCRALGCA